MTDESPAVPDAGGAGVAWREFVNHRRDGMVHALDGGLWFHRHVWRGEPMAHLVSADRAALLRAGARLGLSPEWLQYKPLKDPRTGARVPAWHWDLRGQSLNRAAALAAMSPQASSEVTRSR